jgi:hypothetical protein
MRCIARSSFLLLRVLVWITGLKVKIGLISGVLLGCLLALVWRQDSPSIGFPSFFFLSVLGRLVFYFIFFLHEVNSGL